MPLHGTFALGTSGHPLLATPSVEMSRKLPIAAIHPRVAMAHASSFVQRLWSEGEQ